MFLTVSVFRLYYLQVSNCQQHNKRKGFLIGHISEPKPCLEMLSIYKILKLALKLLSDTPLMIYRVLAPGTLLQISEI